MIGLGVALVCGFGIAFLIGVLSAYRKQIARRKCESVHCEPDPAWDVYIDHSETGVARAIPRSNETPGRSLNCGMDRQA